LQRPDDLQPDFSLEDIELISQIFRVKKQISGQPFNSALPSSVELLIRRPSTVSNSGDGESPATSKLISLTQTLPSRYDLKTMRFTRKRRDTLHSVLHYSAASYTQQLLQPHLMSLLRCPESPSPTYCPTLSNDLTIYVIPHLGYLLKTCITSKLLHNHTSYSNGPKFSW